MIEIKTNMIMKTKILLSTFIIATFIFSGCHDDLNVNHKSGITANNMWVDESDAVAALNGAFRQFRSAYSVNYAFWGEYRSGLWGPGSDGSESYRDEVYLNKIPSSNGFCNWTSLYTTINNCNLILKYTPDITFSNEDNKKKVLANALYIRAFCYYWIARIWGDAPLLLSGFESDKQEDLFPERTSAESIFNRISTDIEEALKLMPENVSDRNMGSRMSLNMLNADFHLWMAKVRGTGTASLTEARKSIDAVKANGNYSLSDNFASVFDVKNKLNKEIIFAWSLLRDEATGGYHDVFLEAIQNVTPSLYENPVKVGSVRQRCFYTPEYMEFLATDTRDSRTATSYETFYDEGKSRMQQWINKFAGTWEENTRIFDSDIIVYRYADALLFSAEIENALGNTENAVDELNLITKRAYGIDSYYPKTLSKSEIDEKILEERMKEFAAEGKLWWDFIRFGVVFDKVETLRGRQNEKNILLWPVADASINRNPNIKQTDFGK
jgi:hypothetical protein